MLSRPRTSFLQDLTVAAPGRLGRTIELTIVVSIVVLVSMTYQIPEPGLSAYIVFFVSKEDAGRSIVISVVFIVAILVVIGAFFVLLPYSLEHPSSRILFIAATSFSLFFLGSASKLAPLAGTLGLVLASALNTEQDLPDGEIATRAVLYILLVAIFPILVQIAFSVFFGRQPDRLLRRELKKRLDIAAAALRGDPEVDHAGFDAAVAAADTELLAQLKMAGLFHLLPKGALARFKVLIGASYGLLVALRYRRKEVAADEAPLLAARLDELAALAEVYPRRKGRRRDPGDATSPVSGLISAMEEAFSDAPLPAAPSPAKAEKSGFFKPGAFTDPVHERFAAKATAAVLTCYFVFNIADWPKISTCLITCFIVALSTNGESTQKMALRITGCLLGAAVGYAAILFVLPHTTQIVGLLILIAAITVPAAWIGFGNQRVSYIGFQMAFAAYLCMLQGSKPEFDLTIARDRIVGILFGNVVVYAYFVSVYPTSLLPGLTRQLVAILERCRSVVQAAREDEPALSLANEVAGLQAMVGGIDQAVFAYGYEKRSGRLARLQTRACLLIQCSLHLLVAEIAAFSVLRPTEKQEECSQVEGRLAALANSISRRTDIETFRRSAAWDVGDKASAAVGRINAAIDRLAVTTSRYRRIARRDEGGFRA